MQGVVARGGWTVQYVRSGPRSTICGWNVLCEGAQERYQLILAGISVGVDPMIRITFVV